ncbi:MAG: hypothetical protein ACI35T_07890 [Alistipes sp.]
MQINSVTRQSGLLATLLLLLLVIAAVIATAVRAGDEYTGFALVQRAFWISILMFATGMVVGRMSIKLGIVHTFCTLPLPMFGIIACSAQIDIGDTAVSAAALSLAAALLLLLECIVEPNAKNPIFFGAILLGVTMLLYPPCILLVALLPIVAVIAGLSLRQIITGIVGWLLPLLVVGYVEWYAGNEALSIWYYVTDAVAATRPAGETDTVAVASIAIFAIAGLLIVAGIVARCMDKGTMLVNLRKSLHILTVTLLLLLVAAALPCRSLSLVGIMAVPAAVLVSSALEHGRSDVATIIYWLLLLLLLLHIVVG